MKTLYLLALLSLLSCTVEVVDEVPSVEVQAVSPHPNIEVGQSILTIGNDTVMGRFTNVDSLEVAGQVFRIFSFFSGVTYLLDNENNLIHKDEDYTHEQEQVDFNKDGYKDLRYKYLTNVPGVDKLLLFDTVSNVFREVDNFSKFPASVAIKGTNYYYSYVRAGCADHAWRSKLFVLDNFHCVEIGEIYGRGCKGTQSSGIFIYRVENDLEIPVDSILRPPGYYEDKWEFIENYWSQHYEAFL